MKTAVYSRLSTPTPYQTQLPQLPVVNSSKCEVKTWSPFHDSWKKNAERGNWVVSNICSSSCTPEEILEEWATRSGDSWQHDAGAMCMGWHMVGNYAETHGWPEARYSAQHYWVRAELQTDTQSAFKSFAYCAKSSEQASFPGQHPAQFSWSYTQWHMWINLGWVGPHMTQNIKQTQHVNTYLLTGQADYRLLTERDG